MADAKICDRCEKVIKRNNERWHMEISRDRNPYIFKPYCEALDLCEECHTEFKKFLVDGKKKESCDE